MYSLGRLHIGCYLAFLVETMHLQIRVWARAGKVALIWAGLAYSTQRGFTAADETALGSLARDHDGRINSPYRANLCLRALALSHEVSIWLRSGNSSRVFPHLNNLRSGQETNEDRSDAQTKRRHPISGLCRRQRR